MSLCFRHLEMSLLFGMLSRAENVSLIQFCEYSIGDIRVVPVNASVEVEGALKF